MVSVRGCRHIRAHVFAPLWQAFDYRWPASLGEPLVGLRIAVPFGHGKRQAVICELLDGEPDAELKTVLDRFDLFPLYNKPYRRWLERGSNFYLSPQGMMYEQAFAWAANDKQRRFRCPDEQSRLKLDGRLGKAFKTKRAITFTTIARHCPSDGLQWRLLKALQQGSVEEVVTHLELQTAQNNHDIRLRPQQQLAVDHIVKHQHEFAPMLLFGCTGSGKTEVYLQAAERLVKEGKQVLILVPEIGLTPMWLSRLASRFERIGIWHSGLSVREKISARHQLPDLEVILGTRSALCLPLNKLGLIVIDEEHDTSLKQQDGVPYSARDLSLLLAQELQIPVVMGSATPSLESWRLVEQGKMQSFRLTQRVHQHTAASPEIIDMRGSTDVISESLLQRIRDVHARGEQSMLYLNRRGYAPALQCSACGDVPACRSCSMRLTLHRKDGMLRCHACDYSIRVYRECKKCGEQALLPLGSGTEKLEDELIKAIPTIKLARFDRDVIRHHLEMTRVLSEFEAGEIDCLIGTQMLVKGHHFPNVTLVGVVNADLGMNLPDFRASERWWQMMTQVFGRTGRGERAGQVVVQTWNPDAPWFDRLDENNAEAVLNDELMLRQITSFPPYGRWVRIVFSAVQEDKAKQAAFVFAQHLHHWEEVKFSGPMPCALEKLAGRHRFELIIRDDSRRHLPWKLLPLLQTLRIPSGVRRKVDVDPQDLM